MNVFYLLFGAFYLIGMLNGIVIVLVITRLFQMRKAKQDAAAQEIIAEQKAEIERLRNERV